MIVSLLTTTLATFLSLLAVHYLTPFGSFFNYMPSGPFSILFGLVYQYMRLIPVAYQFRIFGVGFTDKVWVYAIAIQVSDAPQLRMMCVYNLPDLHLC